jgi:hypothetical protein
LILYFVKERKSNNSRIIKYIGNDKFNIGHQNRVKNKLINGVNQIILVWTNENLIIVKTDMEDKSGKFYYINKMYYKLFRKLLHTLN